MLATGTCIGPYSILRTLGVGGMGETYVAQRRADPEAEHVCLKIVRRDLVGDPRFVALFLDEVRLHAHLSHENIVRVLDFGEANTGYYCAMELIDGTSLDNLLRFARASGERLPASVGTYVLRELCKALGYAHNLEIDGARQQLVHRDVSPSNVIVSRQGEVKLTDFGIAQARARLHHTTAGVVRGKLAYMAPEQIRGEALDVRCDLFALGIMAYQVFAGAHPFTADEDASELLVVHHILNDERKPLLQAAPWLAGKLIDLTECLLATDRALRPQAAASVLELLEVSGEVTDSAREELRVLTQRLLSQQLPVPEATVSGPRVSVGDQEPRVAEDGPSYRSAAFVPAPAPRSGMAYSARPQAERLPTPRQLAETRELEPKTDMLVLERDADHVMTIWRNFCVLIWARQTLPRDVRSAEAALGRLALACPGGIGLIQVVEKDCNSLPAESRQLLNEIYAQQRTLRCSAVVMEGAGFRAASTRMIVAAIARAAAPHVPVRLFATVGAAASWESQYFVPADQRSELSEALEAAVQHSRSLSLTG